MNKIQKILLAIYLPYTVLIIILVHLFLNNDFAQYVKYASSISQFLIVMFTLKKYPEQKTMAWAFLFMLLADFFLVFSTTIHAIKISLDSIGMGFFLVAYVFLVVVYQKNFKIGKQELIAAFLIFGTLLAFMALLIPHIKGIMLVLTLVFGFGLSYMAWAAVCTLFRNYYTKRTAQLIALSGLLMYISDLAVALAMFHPYFAGAFNPWLDTLIWLTYLPSWMLLNIVIHEDHLRKEIPVSP
jgi:hypothetical protein